MGAKRRKAESLIVAEIKDKNVDEIAKTNYKLPQSEKRYKQRNIEKKDASKR